MILVLDDDRVMGRCLARILEKNKKTVCLFNNAIDAMEMVNEEIPEMVIMDVYLTGPDGFTFINEMASYADTMTVPIVIASEKDFSKIDLKAYNVVGFLDKNTMQPKDVEECIKKYA